MEKTFHFSLYCYLLSLSLTALTSCLLFTAISSQPLSTDSRWIVNESGNRVKLACVNWPSHLESVVAEGLSKQPVDEISAHIRVMGFNCVRLTWPLFLFTNDTLASVTVRESFKNVGLIDSIEAAFQDNNPDIIDLSLMDAYKAVVASLAKKNVLIILDNHTSKPGWCCSNSDGNGFFGDRYFDPNLWIKGLTKVAATFKGTQNVVAMSLRNELRGLRQNVKDWYRYMQKGAEAVHGANPNILVILSGLQFDRDLSFLQKRAVTLSFANKLVFELHWYGFSDGEDWLNGNPNQVCGRIVADTMRKGGFLLDRRRGYPLFLSEFGVDMKGTNVNDNRYLNCFMGWAAELDLDWALWALTGSYYIRQGVIGFDEYYGVYNWDWRHLRNQTMLTKISSLQYPFRGPGYEETPPHKVLFHPMTGLCVKRLSNLQPPLVLGACSEAQAWKYTPQMTLTLVTSSFCLQGDEIGQPAKLMISCPDDDSSSKWEAISDSKMHLSSTLEDGTRVCLDIDSSNNVITNNCKCLDTNRDCDPASQWFKVIDSTRLGDDSDVTLFEKISSVVKDVARKFLIISSL